MSDLIYSIFFHPVPAWVVWLYVGGTLVFILVMRGWYEQMTSICEEILLQQARDAAFPPNASDFSSKTPPTTALSDHQPIDPQHLARNS